MQLIRSKHLDLKGWLLLSQNPKIIQVGKNHLRSSSEPLIQLCQRCWEPLELPMGSHSSQMFGNTAWKFQNSVDAAGRDAVIPTKIGL